MMYNYMYYNEDSEKAFGDWIQGFDWTEVLSESGSNNKANKYQGIVLDALGTLFPVITTRRKSTELPRINGRIRRLIRRRKAIFKQTGRCRI